MAEVKWIKITTTIFDDEKIKLIDSMPERDAIFYIWIRLLVLAGKTNSDGCIFLAENIPYTDEMFSAIFNRPLNVIRLALETFKRFNMVEILDNNFILISNWSKHQSIDKLEKMKEQTRQRVANHRAKKKSIQAPANEEMCGANSETACNDSCNVTETLRNAIEGEEEGEGDIEEDITTTPTTKKSEQDIIKFFNNNMGHLMTPYELETLRSYIDDGMEIDVVVLALEEAIEADARDMRYVKKVLNRWLDHGLVTVDAVKADKRNFSNKQRKGGNTTNGNVERSAEQELREQGIGL